MKSFGLSPQIYSGSAIAVWSALGIATEHLEPPFHVVIKPLFFFGSKEEMFTVIAELPGEKLLCSEGGEGVSWVFKLNEGGALEISYVPSTGMAEVSCTFYGPYEKALTYLLEKDLRESTQYPDRTDVVFAFAPKDKVQLVYRQFDSIPFEDIKANYAERAQTGLQELIAQLMDPSQAGLGVVHGPPGTGKTYAIRSILSELRPIRTGIVCVPPSLFLSQSHLMCEAISQHESTLVVLEDVGEMFSEDAKVRFSDQFSTLANITDGLMSLLGNVAFLLTFNYDVGKLDPALTRPGRCLAEVEVPLLSASEAQGVLGSDLVLREEREHSLAELYAVKREAGEHRFAAPKKTMGFAGADLRSRSPALDAKFSEVTYRYRYQSDGSRTRGG